MNWLEQVLAWWIVPSFPLAFLVARYCRFGDTNDRPSAAAMPGVRCKAGSSASTFTSRGRAGSN